MDKKHLKDWHYILDEQGNPVAEPDFIKWSRWYQDSMEQRRVGSTYFANETIHASTVFLSLVHESKDLHETRPMLYETMVFADEAILLRIMELAETDERSIISSFLGGVDFQVRYATKQDAEAGHKRICDFIQLCIDKELLAV